MLPHYVRHHQPSIECTLSCSKPSCYDVTLFLKEIMKTPVHTRSNLCLCTESMGLVPSLLIRNSYRMYYAPDAQMLTTRSVVPIAIG